MTSTYTDVILYEYFGEYLSMLHDRKWREGYARSFVIVDFYHATDAGLKVDTSELPAHIKEALEGFGDPNGGYLFLVNGDTSGHLALFDEMVSDLIQGPQGGDDDTFDYWPGGMDCLEMYAILLSENTKDDYYIREVGRVAAANQTVPEWEENAHRLMELANAI